MTDASQFSRLAHAPEHIPWWYWNRVVIQRLRDSLRNLLNTIGIAPQTQVLELGCGNRPYEHLVRQCGGRYAGADLAGNIHADLVIDDAGRVPSPDRSFDVVLSIQVLEHVPDPAAYLAEARRLLKPQGRLILSTHGFWVYHPSPGDYWRWTSAGLQKMLREQGFEVLDFRGLVGVLPGGLQLMQDAIRRRLPRLLRKPFSGMMQVLVALADRLTSENSRKRDAMIYMVLLAPTPVQ